MGIVRGHPSVPACGKEGGLSEVDADAGAYVDDASELSW